MSTVEKLTMKTGIVACLLAALAVVMLPGCAGKSSETAVPYLPPAYYSCTETDFGSLQYIFFFHPGTVTDEQLAMKGQVFVIKNIQLTQHEIEQATNEYILVDFIKCYWLDPANLESLKPDEMIDLVGVNQGAIVSAPDTLDFTGCVLLPAGLVQLPVGGTPVTGLNPY